MQALSLIYPAARVDLSSLRQAGEDFQYLKLWDVYLGKIGIGQRVISGRSFHKMIDQIVKVFPFLGIRDYFRHQDVS